jgi:hypothetical protein
MFQAEKDPLHLVGFEPHIASVAESTYCLHIPAPVALYIKKKNYHNLDMPVCIVTWTFYK